MHHIEGLIEAVPTSPKTETSRICDVRARMCADRHAEDVQARAFVHTISRSPSLLHTYSHARMYTRTQVRASLSVAGKSEDEVLQMVQRIDQQDGVKVLFKYALPSEKDKTLLVALEVQVALSLKHHVSPAFLACRSSPTFLHASPMLVPSFSVLLCGL